MHKTPFERIVLGCNRLGEILPDYNPNDNQRMNLVKTPKKKMECKPKNNKLYNKERILSISVTLIFSIFVDTLGILKIAIWIKF